MFIFLVNKCC